MSPVAPNVLGLDHIVLTVRDLEETVRFYEEVVGMRAFTFAGGTRTALAFGAQKINLHELGREVLPNAHEAGPGTADFCLLVDTPIEEVVDHLGACSVAVEQGPDGADGATGPLRSVWFRDPDGNLVELSERIAA
jgi:catechol 2,3-dioxygenase-like lactoylglutathione lyase family enzyme